MRRNHRSPEQGNGAPEPGDPPNVYLPRSVPSPAYDAYADPAAAHGWQNAYDETAELPPVVEGGAVPVVGEAPPGPEGPGGHRSHRAARHRAGRSAPRSFPRVATASGVLGAVSAAVLIAGFAFSGSPSGGTGGKGGRTGPTAAEPDAGPSVRPDATGAPAAGVRPAEPSPRAEGTSGAPVPTPSAPASTTSTPTLPTATAPSAEGPGQAGPGDSGDRPGRGHGATKRPK